MTSIEWLAEMASKMGYVSADIIEQAKEMHRQEIINAVRVVLPYGPNFTEAEEYYNKTFKKKQ